MATVPAQEYGGSPFGRLTPHVYAVTAVYLVLTVSGIVLNSLIVVATLRSKLACSPTNLICSL